VEGNRGFATATFLVSTFFTVLDLGLRAGILGDDQTLQYIIVVTTLYYLTPSLTLSLTPFHHPATNSIHSAHTLHHPQRISTN
jgi:hypothetical protein